MKTEDLEKLHEETINCNLQSFNKYTKKNYSLEGINEFMASVAKQHDYKLYFPISVYIHHAGRIFTAFITSPIHIKYNNNN